MIFRTGAQTEFHVLPLGPTPRNERRAEWRVERRVERRVGWRVERHLERRFFA